MAHPPAQSSTERALLAALALNRGELDPDALRGLLARLEAVEGARLQHDE